MKKILLNKLILYVVIIIVIAIVGLFVWVSRQKYQHIPINTNTKMNSQNTIPPVSPTGTTIDSSNMQDCSYPNNMCHTGYECFTSVTGGLGPSGSNKLEIVAGDQKCHKVCSTNADCASPQKCMSKQLQREDYTSTVQLCL